MAGPPLFFGALGRGEGGRAAQRARWRLRRSAARRPARRMLVVESGRHITHSAPAAGVRSGIRGRVTPSLSATGAGSGIRASFYMSGGRKALCSVAACRARGRAGSRARSRQPAWGAAPPPPTTAPGAEPASDNRRRNSGFLPQRPIFPRSAVLTPTPRNESMPGETTL